MFTEKQGELIRNMYYTTEPIILLGNDYYYKYKNIPKQTINSLVNKGCLIKKGNDYLINKQSVLVKKRINRIIRKGSIATSKVLTAEELRNYFYQHSIVLNRDTNAYEGFSIISPMVMSTSRKDDRYLCLFNQNDLCTVIRLFTYTPRSEYYIKGRNLKMMSFIDTNKKYRKVGLLKVAFSYLDNYLKEEDYLISTQETDEGHEIGVNNILKRHITNPVYNTDIDYYKSIEKERGD